MNTYVVSNTNFFICFDSFPFIPSFHFQHKSNKTQPFTVYLSIFPSVQRFYLMEQLRNKYVKNLKTMQLLIFYIIRFIIFTLT